jgi:hypothetical protein
MLADLVAHLQRDGFLMLAARYTLLQTLRISSLLLMPMMFRAALSQLRHAA